MGLMPVTPNPVGVAAAATQLAALDQSPSPMPVVVPSRHARSFHVRRGHPLPAPDAMPKVATQSSAITTTTMSTSPATTARWAAAGLAYGCGMEWHARRAGDHSTLIRCLADVEPTPDCGHKLASMFFGKHM
jgi:DNA-binding transcriptional LysR family regulator